MISFETRFTRENGVHPQTFWPMGIMHSWTSHGQRFEIGYRDNPLNYFSIDPEWNDGRYAAILQGDGTPIYKFVMPTQESAEPKIVRFVYDGIWYTLEIRVDFKDQEERLF